jgi:hypothetical protein
MTRLAQEVVDNKGGGPGLHGPGVEAGLGHEGATLVPQEAAQDPLVLQHQHNILHIYCIGCSVALMVVVC